MKPFVFCPWCTFQIAITPVPGKIEKCTECGKDFVVHIRGVKVSEYIGADSRQWEADA